MKKVIFGVVGALVGAVIGAVVGSAVPLLMSNAVIWFTIGGIPIGVLLGFWLGYLLDARTERSGSPQIQIQIQIQCAKYVGGAALSLGIQMVLLVAMLFVHIVMLIAYARMPVELDITVFVGTFYLTLPLIMLSGVVVMAYGLNVTWSCRWTEIVGPVGRYGLSVAFYGIASSGLAIWFMLFAVFGGPARDELPLFYVCLLLVINVICVPVAFYLQRRSEKYLQKTP